MLHNKFLTTSRTADVKTYVNQLGLHEPDTLRLSHPWAFGSIAKPKVIEVCETQYGVMYGSNGVCPSWDFNRIQINLSPLFFKPSHSVAEGGLKFPKALIKLSGVYSRVYASQLGEMINTLVVRAARNVFIKQQKV